MNVVSRAQGGTFLVIGECETEDQSAKIVLSVTGQWGAEVNNKKIWHRRENDEPGKERKGQ